MILLPIGHEQTGTRRLPWVTFGVMILCGAAFFLSGRAALVVEKDSESSGDAWAALEYYLEHPYLELDPEFERQVFPGGASKEALREAYGETIGAVPSRPSSGEIREAEQEILDKLVDRALRGLGAEPLRRWGLIPRDISFLGLFTHMFLHAGWLHLLGNLLILYLAGPFIEDVWGRPLFLGFYLLSGLVAALVYIASNPDSSVPMIGASGAIAGVMGAFLVRYRFTRIRFFYMIGLFWRGVFSAPAWIMLPMWFGEQLFMATLTGKLGHGSGGGVAYWAHVGGFGFGFGAALVLRSMRVEERYITPTIEEKIHKTLVSNPVVERALAEQEWGRPEHAFDLLAEEVGRARGNQDAALALWSVAVQLNRAEEASAGMLRAIEQELRSGDADLALEHWSELSERLPGIEAEPRLLLRLAQTQLDRGCHEEAVVTLRRTLLAIGRRSDGAMALRVARLGLELDPGLARGAARLALAGSGLDPVARAEAERLLRELPEGTSRSSIAVP